MQFRFCLVFWFVSGCLNVNYFTLNSADWYVILFEFWFNFEVWGWVLVFDCSELEILTSISFLYTFESSGFQSLLVTDKDYSHCFVLILSSEFVLSFWTKLSNRLSIGSLFKIKCWGGNVLKSSLLFLRIKILLKNLKTTILHLLAPIEYLKKYIDKITL